MFAYCNNNPIANHDLNGKDPVLIAAAGGAVAGAFVGLFHYLNNSGQDATVGGALLAMTGGFLAGALGGAAGMLTGSAQLTAVLCSGIVAGLFGSATGGDFMLSAIFGLIGAWGGTLIDISMYQGIELFFANLVASLGVGYPVEMAAQSTYQDFSPKHSDISEPMSTSSTIGSGNQVTSGGGVGRSVFYVSLMA